MRGKTANKILRTLEGVIKDGADKVSMQWLSNVVNTKITVLDATGVDEFLQVVERILETRTVQPEELLSLKLIIYSVGQIKTKDEKQIDFYKAFVNKMVRLYIQWGKHVKLIEILLFCWMMRRLTNNWWIAKERKTWRHVNHRHVSEIIYTLARMKIYDDINIYDDLYDHIRHKIDKLNNQDLCLLIWAFSRIKALAALEGKEAWLAHQNFSIDKSIKILSQKAAIKIPKMDGKSASIIYNALRDNPSHSSITNQLSAKLKTLSKAPAP